MSEREVERLREENASLHAQVEAARRQADQWRAVAEERRVTLERLRQHPVVRALLRVAEVLLPWLRTARHRAEPARRGLQRLRRTASAARTVPAALGAPTRDRLLRRKLAGLPAPVPDPRLVSVIVLTRDGRDRLATLLPALRRTAHEHLEVVVVDNASGEPTRAWLAEHHEGKAAPTAGSGAARQGVRVVRLDEHASFSAANQAGVEAATGDALLFLNDDVEPLDEHWLGRMLALLDGEVAAVGAQLVYPPARPLASRHPPLTVQHLGTELVPGPGVPAARNITADEPDPTLAPRPVAAATAACLLVDRAAYEAAGGLDDRYDFGAEDVDLCWRLRRAGREVVVQPAAVLYHHEGATRHAVDDPGTTNARQRRNWDALADRFGPELRRAVALDRLAGTGRLSGRPYTIAITVTRELEAAGYGDLATARELRTELERLGWEVRFVERYRDAWYDLDGDVDAVLVLLDTFDVRRVARPGLTTVAWVRNWADRWAAHPWFDAYDLVLASSGAVAERLAATTRHHPVVFPLATNPDRFRPGVGAREGVVLAVNHHGSDRGVPKLLAAVPDLELHGKGWEREPAVAEAWRGQRRYDELPALYARAEVLVDQAAHHTAADASVNARVFDGLAAGASVVTDQVDGARELFGDDLPTYRTPDDLAGVVADLRADPQATRRRVAALRETVLGHHTYRHRAERLRDLLVDRTRRASFALLIGAPSERVAPTWGDHHLAHALAAELRALGHEARVVTADRWDDRDVASCDVALHLHGRGRAPRREGQTHVLWVISHPDELTDEELADADLVLAASEPLAEDLRGRTSAAVEVLLQATDHHRFRPLPADPAHTHDLAFVGNSKFTHRPVVADAFAAGLEPALYGANWEKFLDPRHVRQRHVPNEDLPRVYSSVKVLLNDHWPDMRRWGIVANRLFDALACGATVVSDEVAGLDRLFDGAVATYTAPDDLRATVERLLADPAERGERGARGREAVLAAHTFAHRARELLDQLAPVLAERHGTGELAPTGG